MLKNTLIIFNLLALGLLLTVGFTDDQQANNMIEAVFVIMTLLYVIKGVFFIVISDDLHSFDKWMIADKYFKFSTSKTPRYNIIMDLVLPVFGAAGLLMSNSPMLTPWFLGALFIDKVGCIRLLDAYRFHIKD